MRVMVVDDDCTAARGLRSLFALDGHDAEAITAARDAIARLSAERFDVVVTDLEMPGAHGIEVVRAAVAAYPATLVFVVTGYAGTPASEAALAAGARAVLAKPLEYDDLAAIIAQAAR